MHVFVHLFLISRHILVIIYRLQLNLNIFKKQAQQYNISTFYDFLTMLLQQDSHDSEHTRWLQFFNKFLLFCKLCTSFSFIVFAFLNMTCWQKTAIVIHKNIKCIMKSHKNSFYLFSEHPLYLYSISRTIAVFSNFVHWHDNASRSSPSVNPLHIFMPSVGTRWRARFWIFEGI